MFVTTKKMREKPKNESDAFFKNVAAYFREYCGRSSVHGVQYFGEKRTVFEKLWWIFVFHVCLAACTLSIYTVYKKWEQSPVIVSFGNKGTPIYRIPFPAITICPEIKAKRNLFNYTNIMQKIIDQNENITDEENTLFDYMGLVCEYDTSMTYKNTSTVSNDFYDMLDYIKPDFNIFHCSFGGEFENCEELFKPIITNEGICYTFNILDRTEIFKENVIHYKNYHHIGKYSINWTVSKGYTEDAGLKTYPRRALLAGVTNGLSLRIDTSLTDLDYACHDSLQGYRVLVHPPTAMPLPSYDYFRIPLDQHVMGTIYPSMITTSPSVQRYDQKRRRCYFESERRLTYFKIYNSANCYLECLSNFTLYWCGCVGYYMPRENGTEVYGTAKAMCMIRAEREIQMKRLKRKLARRKKKKSPTECYCLPVCSDLNYDIETARTDWEWKKMMLAFNEDLKSYENKSVSSLTLYFKSDNFITSERNELYGPIDFLANFGGLLGLFTGFSILSLIEIVYFLTVRIICNVRLHGKWTGEEEE